MLKLEVFSGNRLVETKGGKPNFNREASKWKPKIFVQVLISDQVLRRWINELFIGEESLDIEKGFAHFGEAYITLKLTMNSETISKSITIHSTEPNRYKKEYAEQFLVAFESAVLDSCCIESFESRKLIKTQQQFVMFDRETALFCLNSLKSGLERINHRLEAEQITLGFTEGLTDHYLEYIKHYNVIAEQLDLPSYLSLKERE